MATLAAKVARRAAAIERLNAQNAELGKRTGVSMPDRPARSIDPDLQPILDIEWNADFIASINAQLSSMAVEGETPAGFDALTVTMLRDELMRRNIDIPAGAKKDDLVKLLEDDEAGA